MSCPCEPASFKPNVRIGARYGKASKHSGHSCPHPERLELPKMIHRQRLQRQFPDQSMGVLLKIEGNCSCLKAKVAHMVGHLPVGASKVRPRICWMRCSGAPSKCWLCSTTCAFLLRTTRPSGTFAGRKCSKRFLAPFVV